MPKKTIFKSGSQLPPEKVLECKYLRDKDKRCGYVSGLMLLGIVHAYIPYREQLVNQQTEEIVEIRSENSGLAWVHPVEQIREVVDLITPKFKLIEAAENGNE